MNIHHEYHSDSKRVLESLRVNFKQVGPNYLDICVGYLLVENVSFSNVAQKKNRFSSQQ